MRKLVLLALVGLGAQLVDGSLGMEGLLERTLAVAERKGVTMASKSAQPATNERIVRLLDEVKAELADAKKREEQIARDLTRLLNRK